jgi:tRNA U34 2-thiouridine synthase MnmA/TrmU
MNNVNFLNSEYKEFFNKNNNLEAKCKIRYRQADQDCTVLKIESDLYEVKFKENQRAIAR